MTVRGMLYYCVLYKLYFLHAEILTGALFVYLRVQSTYNDAN